MVHHQPGGPGQFFQGGFQIAIVINVADEHFRNRQLLRRQRGITHLLLQNLLQRGLCHQRIKHELPLLFGLGGGAKGEIGLGKMVAPFLIELRQPLEFRFERIHRPLCVLAGAGIEIRVRRQLTGFAGFAGGFKLPIVRLRGFSFGRRNLFQDRVLLQFLLDQRLEIQHGRLQEGKRLLQLRRQHLRLHQTLR